jgi:hypothetical protein
VLRLLLRGLLQGQLGLLLLGLLPGLALLLLALLPLLLLLLALLPLLLLGLLLARKPPPLTRVGVSMRSRSQLQRSRSGMCMYCSDTKLQQTTGRQQADDAAWIKQEAGERRRAKATATCIPLSSVQRDTGWQAPADVRNTH